MTPATPNKLRIGFFRYRMWAEKETIFFQVLEQHMPANKILITTTHKKRVEVIAYPEILPNYLFLQGSDFSVDQSAPVRLHSYNAELDVLTWKQALTQLTIE